MSLMSDTGQPVEGHGHRSPGGWGGRGVHRGVQTRRQGAVTTLGVLGAAVLGPACGPGAGAPAAVSRAPVEVTYHARSGPQGDYFKQWGERYTAEHPGVVLRQEQFPGGQYAEKLTALLSAASIGDALWADAISIFGLLMRVKALRDIAPLAKREKFEFGAFFPQATQGVTLDGKSYGVPHSVNPGRTGIFLSSAAFERAGQKLPDDGWTMQELVQVAQRLASTTGETPTYGFAPSVEMWTCVCYIRSFGGEWLSPDGRQLTIDTPAAIQAMQYLADFTAKYQLAPPPGTINGLSYPAALGQGRLAMQQDGYWGGNNVRRDAPGAAFTAVQMPKGLGGSKGMAEFTLNGVTMASKHPDEAFGYCAYMSGEEPAIESALLANAPGARKSAWDHPKLTNREGHGAFARSLVTAPPLLLPANGRGADLAAEWAKQFAALWKGEQTSAQAAVQQALPALKAIVAA